LRRLDVAYFAASVDKPDTNARFAASLNLDFPILSDSSKAVARRYGVLSASGFASRWTFYIGTDGRIAAIDRKVSAGSHGEEIVRTLERMKSEGTSQK
jgi:thioredoxin-dependent peroxiredoxin